MKLAGDVLQLSATDAAHHLGCRHLTQLDLRAVRGGPQPPRWQDPALVLLQQRGLEHENAYIERLAAAGRSVYRFEADGGDDGRTTGMERLRAALQSGADVIVQAPLAAGVWRGRADVLLRVGGPSALGDYAYEVVDTKLARDTRGGTLLQLCLYSELLAGLQGAMPEFMHVVVPGTDFEPQTYRAHDYLAYFRLMKARLLQAVGAAGEAAPSTYPDPVPQCDLCRWWPQCDRQRRADDHLSLVAGISKMQTREVQSWGIATLRSLAGLPLPIAHKPRRGAVEGYTRIREQARVQLQGRESGAAIHELLPRRPGEGLARLPAPCAEDLFFDVEGDPFAGEGGLEYLLGAAVVAPGGSVEYRGHWAHDRETERAALLRFMEDVSARWARSPGLHIYHYTAYDPGALKRLVGRYGAGAEDLDRMLRAGLFVDLHAIVKQSLRASVEQYSIKNLEPFYGFGRAVPLEDAAANRRAIEHALEMTAPEAITAEMRAIVEGYNRDDCISAARLRDWLEQLRSGLVAAGEVIERPAIEDGDASEGVAAKDARARALAEALGRGIPADPEVRTPAQDATWLLAQLIEYHRREEKVAWWDYFRMCELPDDDFVDEKNALGGLEFVTDLGPVKRSRLYRYSFPRQSTDVRAGSELRSGDGTPAGTVHAIDFVAGTVDIKRSGKALEAHPGAVFAFSNPPVEPLPESLYQLGTWVLEHGIDAPGEHRARRDLLLRTGPRLRAGARGLIAQDGEDQTAAACRLVAELDHGVLAVQGPPGTGKTYNGARMITALVKSGCRVGVTAVSHKVIRNLLDAVVQAAAEEDADVRCGHKAKDGEGESAGEASPVRALATNEAALAALQDGSVTVLGATAWLWARADAAAAVDVLFVDEAGQMALANVLAAASGAKNIVLLGDPQQLEQPQKGSHPDGAELSALEHLMRGAKVVPDGMGLFLGETWRLHPALCDYTSEMFYDGRLRPRRGLERQALVGPTRFAGAGPWFAPVPHDGNRGSSAEEVERVRAIVQDLLQEGTAWTDADGVQCRLGLEDVLIVAPYNAQVADLTAALPAGARVGTVDRFQGQEAPVVIYSLATSSAEDAPRGMEFLYSLNRLNVATSRARCAAILVANPRLFEPDCRTPAQMRLANAFCRYVEVARRAE